MTETTDQRRSRLTADLIERQHDAWHKYNGTDVACQRCGTTGGPAWLRRAAAKAAQS